jgi:hypothetical protein
VYRNSSSNSGKKIIDIRERLGLKCWRMMSFVGSTIETPGDERADAE